MKTPRLLVALGLPWLGISFFTGISTGYLAGLALGLFLLNASLIRERFFHLAFLFWFLCTLLQAYYHYLFVLQFFAGFFAACIWLKMEEEKIHCMQKDLDSRIDLYALLLSTSSLILGPLLSSLTKNTFLFFSLLIFITWVLLLNQLSFEKNPLTFNYFCDYWRMKRKLFSKKNIQKLITVQSLLFAQFILLLTLGHDLFPDYSRQGFGCIIAVMGLLILFGQWMGYHSTTTRLEKIEPYWAWLYLLSALFLLLFCYLSTFNWIALLLSVSPTVFALGFFTPYYQEKLLQQEPSAAESLQAMSLGIPLLYTAILLNLNNSLILMLSALNFVLFLLITSARMPSIHSLKR